MAHAITILLGVIVIVIGLVITTASKETAEDLRRASEHTPAPEGFFTSGSVGCAGLAVILVGIVMVLLGLVVR